jgi:UDP-glucuronate decarboxylase
MHLEKRVLVTGGAGFLGSYLCERLLADGAVVLCVDNFFTGARRNIEHLLHHSRFELLRHDVTFPFYVEVDEIYNLACFASPVHYQHDPVQTTKTSVHGAINMLGLAKRVKARLDLRSLWRSVGPSAKGGLLGKRESDRRALMLRRG